MPPELLARFDATKAAAERELKARHAHTDAGRLERAKSSLREVRDQSRTLSALVRAHRDAGIPLALGPETARLLRDAATALQATPDTRDGEVAERAGNDAERGFAAIHATIEAALASGRAEWLAEQPRPNAAFVAVLGKRAATEIRAAEVSVAEVDRLAATPVRSASDVAELADAVAALRANYGHLTRQAPEVVREFLDRVPTGVRLSDVPDDVLSWLRNEAAEAFTIVLHQQ